MFKEQVLEDDSVWVVEFYSSMCGSCKEFSPVWDSLNSKIKSLKTGKINIDDKDGLAVAQKLGVLDEGIPNVQLYASKGTSVSIVKGEVVSEKTVMRELKSRVRGLSRSDDGFYMKA
eukprot:CAMPEP_0185022588 /NCGR_PEP_ID=MMETSP1103-20130426/5287_1 /TAXON_ID=36769 /ORGANISM="Paraphysomonas bandaiensis, Strain Caron Lab Isolate" /LENGTH=116 /DNA_ID=CAMNT_0027554715 /DNA_START=128 /DNA_END=478 /DNA_ORIENTATION=-